MRLQVATQECLKNRSAPMIETVFGAGSPMWPSLPGTGVGFQSPLGVGVGPLSRSAFVPPVTVGPSAGQSALVGAQNLPANPYAYSPFANVPAFAAPNMGLPLTASLGTPLIGSEAVGWTTPIGLLAAVAMRRGQPQGPANDHEAEEFIYDALELLPGASDVEVRCEGGRATLTGTVQYKRLKHDVGEIAWAIPALQDVQNNVTITSRRRTRSATQGEGATSGTGRKQP
jgi:hypothetical protein